MREYISCTWYPWYIPSRIADHAFSVVDGGMLCQKFEKIAGKTVDQSLCRQIYYRLSKK
jgi:hypothetical protein